MFLSIGMLKQKYFLTDIFILSAEKQPIKLSWRKIECLHQFLKLQRLITSHLAKKNNLPISCILSTIQSVISDSIWIGLIEDGNNQYTAIFNPFTNDFGYKKFTRESSVYDIIEPMFSDNNGAIISLISPELNDMCKNYNMLPDSITDALNEGNRVLLINSFKRK